MFEQPIATLEIPQYIIKVKTAEKRRAKYYKVGDKLPVSYEANLKSGRFSFDRLGFLLNDSGKRIMKNPHTAGTPRFETLAGNSFTTGFSSEHQRNSIVIAMKDFFRPFVHQQLRPFPEDVFPLRIEWEIHTIVDEPKYDLSNLWFYWKYLEDTLFEKEYRKNGKTIEVIPIIPDDCIRWITGSPGPMLVPVDRIEDRKFVIRFYSDTRDCILNHPLWQKEAIELS